MDRFVVSGDWIFAVILIFSGILQSGPLVVISGVITPLLGVIYSPTCPFRWPFLVLILTPFISSRHPCSSNRIYYWI